MSTFYSSYPYKFITKITGTPSGVPELFYRFKSIKTNKTYYVHVEMHPNHFYGVKFHLKEHNKNPNKYNIQANLHEARPVVYTCISIMLEIGREDKRSSFGFIGSNTTHLIDRNGGGEIYKEASEKLKGAAKRYNLYKRIMLTFFSDDVFEHYQNEEYSTYMLVRRTELNKNGDLPNQISTYFSDNYDNFR